MRPRAAVPARGLRTVEPARARPPLCKIHRKCSMHTCRRWWPGFGE
uniref:Uncharacterized protein n=1 Tax=Arundo donax TaxID=35708 RepID=A0A0A8YN35_ARUDO